MSVITIDREGDVAVVTLDNPPVNAISAAVRQELSEAVERLDSDAGIRAVVLICAGRTFVAGADVAEFGAVPVPPHLPDVIAAIEGSRAPWIAAIHGTALGGGFEIAMGCRFRLMTADGSVGLPETTLGLVPGAGGTARTPRLAGVVAAVRIVTQGRPVDAARALEMGLVDDVVTGDLKEAAVTFARGLDVSALPQSVSARPIETMAEAFWREAEAALRDDGNSGPRRALDLIRLATATTFSEAMGAERAAFLDMRAAPEVAALRQVFFAERAARKPSALKGIAPRSFTSVGVVGGGTMGAGIATALLGAGLPVTMIERDNASVSKGHVTVASLVEAGVKRGTLTPEAARMRLDGLTVTTEYDALADCDMVIEAVFEDIEVKRPVFETLVRVCRPDAILATNTSYLDPAEIARTLDAPERFLGLHFFSPAHVMKLLEIVPVPQTAPDVLATAFTLAARLGKVPVRAGICEGFIGNRILKRYRAEAERLVRDGVDIAAVDAAMRDFGFRMGPFEAQDMGGLDIAFLQREGARKTGQDVPETLGDVLVRAGRKGQKTGGGWYDYATGDRTPRPSETVHDLVGAGPVRTMATAAIADILVGAMADEGHDILAEGIADSAADIDLVEVHGYGFPRVRGGPMHWASTREAIKII